jgi:hypothetical protein
VVGLRLEGWDGLVDLGHDEFLVYG